MRIRMELIESIEEDEIVIRCNKMNQTIHRIHQSIAEIASRTSAIVFYKKNQEYYFPMEEVLFFETELDNVYAHTADDAYLVKYRLYELEDILPHHFTRISKTTILNVSHILSIHRNITSASLIQFHKSHKQVYVSRYYYRNLRQKLDVRR